MLNIISIKGLCKAFNGKQVLKNINLKIPQVGIFGIIGLNGAGKTTTIKCLLNLITEFEGEVLIDDLPSSQVEARKTIAYMPERFSPNLNITGIEYVQTYCKIYKTSFLESKVYKIAKSISLPVELLQLKIKECSKGTVQKIGILACLCVNVKAIILDEPTSGLDILARRQLKNALLEHSKTKAIVFSSHILPDVQELASNVAVISDGSIAFAGSLPDFLQKGDENIEEVFLKLIG